LTPDFGLFDCVPIGIIVCDREMTVRFWNASMEYWTDVRRQAILGKRLGALFPRFESESFRARLELLEEGGPPVIFSYQLNGCLFPHSDPRRIERVQHVTATSFSAEDGNRLMLLAVEDRTEVSARIRAARTELALRVETEESLRSSVQEKEYLMKELNHRVKNNLNMISSLIGIQKEGMSDGPLRAALDDLDGRIRSFSVLHESMHKRETSMSVRLDDYLGTIATDLFDTVRPADCRTKLELDIPNIEMGFKQALYLGLIVSETLTNSLKYGRNECSENRVEIRLRVDGGRAELTVADDGPGFPEGFDPAKTDSLGLKLVKLLAEELCGTISFESRNGARITVAFSTDSGSTGA